MPKRFLFDRPIVGCGVTKLVSFYIKINILKICFYSDLNCVSHLLHDDNLPHMIAFLMVTSAFITKQTNKGELNSFLFKSQVGFYLKNSLKIFWDNT